MSESSRNFQICIIGAGLSGLCAAIQLKRKLGEGVKFVIYESNSEVGGNWLVNAYPGCACDIQSHLYSYSFAPKSDWTKEFAAQPEILEYIKDVAGKYELYKDIQFRTQVTNLTWLETVHKWRVTTLSNETKVQEETLYDIIINGSGRLRIPDIPDEFRSFKGTLVHSAQWDPNLKLEGKRVAVIGSGATAIQLIPGIASKVGKLLAYQRQPAWVIPSFQTSFSKMTRAAFAKIAGLRSAYRSLLFLSNEMLFPVFESGTAMNKIAYPAAIGLTKFHLNHQIKSSKNLRKALLPDYRFGCKRVGISNKYYPALQLPHVDLVTSRISKVDHNSITTEDGQREEIDVLILATGFRVHDYFAPMEIIGKDSHNISSSWKSQGPSTYLGIASSDLPNHFMLLGPGSDLNHNSAIFQIECQMHFIIRLLKKMQKQGSTFVAVKSSSEREYMERAAKEMLSTVYGRHDCGSWFADARGVVTELYPKTAISYWRRTRRVNFSHFDFK